VEIQGTAEGEAFTEAELAALLELGKGGIKKLVSLQKQALGLRALPPSWT
jgi:ribonuclease PH